MDLERHDRIMIRTLIIVVPIIILVAVLWKEGKIFKPVIQECGKVIQRETTDGGLAGRITEGKLQMTGGRKSFSLNGYAVDGDTVCKDGESRVKKDAFIVY